MDNRRVFAMAMARGCKVKMIYQKDDGVIERIITPHHFAGDLVKCYDHFKRQRRNYKLERVLAVSLLGCDINDH